MGCSVGVGAGAGARRQAQPTQRTGDGSGGGDAGELALLDAEAHPTGHALGGPGVVGLADGGLAGGGAGGVGHPQLGDAGTDRRQNHQQHEDDGGQRQCRLGCHHPCLSSSDAPVPVVDPAASAGPTTR